MGPRSFVECGEGERGDEERALSVHAGFTANGLPASFQLIGRPFAEGRLLRVAAAFDREVGFSARRPPPVDRA